MTRVQTGVRVDRHLLPVFKEMCNREGFGLGEAVEAFMRTAVEVTSVKLALDGAVRTSDARKATDVLLMQTRIVDLDSLVAAAQIELKNASLFHPASNERTLREKSNSILDLLPRIEDIPLRKKASESVEKAMKYLEAERLENARVRNIFG